MLIKKHIVHFNRYWQLLYIDKVVYEFHPHNRERIVKLLLILTAILSLHCSSAFAKTILNKKTGSTFIKIDEKTLFSKPNDKFYFFLEWPEINKWTSLFHSSTIKSLALGRDRLITEMLLAAKMNNGFLKAEILTERFLEDKIAYPGCHRRPYMTCEDLGYDPVMFVEEWESIKIKIGSMDISSYALISRKF